MRAEIFRSRRWGRALTSRLFSGTLAFRCSTSVSAERAKAAACTTRATTLSSITAASSIRASCMTPCWPRRSGAWCCAWPTPTFRCRTRAILQTAVSDYLEQVKKLADGAREESESQAKLLHDRAFQLAADPTEPSGVPDRAGPRSANRVRTARERRRSSQAQRQGIRRRAGQERARAVRRAARTTAGADVRYRSDSRARRGPAGAELVQESRLRARPLHRLWRQDAARRARGDRGPSAGRTSTAT